MSRITLRMWRLFYQKSSRFFVPLEQERMKLYRTKLIYGSFMEAKNMDLYGAISYNVVLRHFSVGVVR